MWLDFLNIKLPVAGIETFALIPPAVAFGISFFTSMAGVSGAFLLMPFQISVLGFVSPSVTATNLLYNVVGTPGGVVQYAREKRVAWRLATSIAAGALPGVLVGYYLRATFLPDSRNFKLFVGIVLMVAAWRLIMDIWANLRSEKPAPKPPGASCSLVNSNRPVCFFWHGQPVCYRIPAVLVPAFCVGIIGGTYGIGGGAIMAPFLVTVLHLPVHAIAGAVLLANFVVSLAGVTIYSLVPFYQGVPAPPDWLLGTLFGVGGILGMNCGARFQRKVSAKAIKLILVVIVGLVASRYIVQYF